MLIVQICIGSSCYIKGAPDIVALLQADVEGYHLENDVVLTGSFCTGKCNRAGVTISINDEVYTGITKENYREFFNEKILKVVQANKG
jgi:NADH:ubiquinone oxidoreductase subunit E